MLRRARYCSGKSSVRQSVRTSYICDVEVSQRLEFFENKVNRNFATSVNNNLVGPGIFYNAVVV